MAIVKPAGVLERNLGREELERIWQPAALAGDRGKNAAPSGSPYRPAGGSGGRVAQPELHVRKVGGENDTIENRIDVYEDRVRGWLVRWADYLNSVKIDDRKHAGFAVLHLSLAYFEAFAIFLRGREAPRGKSFEFFRVGMLEVFPEFKVDAYRESILRILWQDGRNGLFHRGLTLKRLRLRDDLERAFRLEAVAGEERVCVPT
jgi:hypothetical protein